MMEGIIIIVKYIAHMSRMHVHHSDVDKMPFDWFLK